MCKGVQYDLLVGGRENTIKSNQHLSITHSGGFVPYKSHIHLALGKHILHRVSIIIFYYNSEPVGGLSRIFFSFCYSVKSPNMTGIQPFFFSSFLTGIASFEQHYSIQQKKDGYQISMLKN